MTIAVVSVQVTEGKVQMAGYFCTECANVQDLISYML